jgi:hypothetical protein
MSNMKTVALIADTLKQERTEVRDELHHFISALADEIVSLQRLIAEAKMDIAKLRRDVDELMKPL